MVKYGENMYLATMKVLWDELYEICQAHQINYHEFRKLLMHDKRISPYLSLIFLGARGFGGKCLPKDTRALVRASEKAGYDPKFLKAVIAANERFRNR